MAAESRMAVHGDIAAPTDELDRFIAKCKKSGSFSHKIGHQQNPGSYSTMPQVVFTENLKRHVDCASAKVEGRTVKEVLGKVFENNPRLERYVLDDQGALRKHMLVFVDGSPAKDRIRLSDPVSDSSEVFVMQALSGG